MFFGYCAPNHLPEKRVGDPDYLKPCSYKEYKIVNSNPKDLMINANVPDDQIAIVLWAVTQYTQFEEEVHYNTRKIIICILSGALIPVHILAG